MNALILLEGVRAGGAERDVLRLAGGLRSRGHQVAIGAAGAPMLELAREAGHETLSLERARQRRIVAWCRERRVDVVNAHSLRTVLAAGLALRSRRLGVRLVATVHNVHDRRNDRLARWVLRWLPDEVLFVSRYEQERLAAGRRPLGRVVPTGVEALDPDAVEPVDLAVRHGIPPGARVIGYVGRLSPEKALGDALAALARLPDDVVLCLVGSGPEEPALRRAVAGSPLGRRVFFAGFRDDVAAYLAAFRVLVLPSRRESLPVVLREAGVMRLPAVAADVGGVGEILVDGESGLLYPTGDLAALEAALRALLDAPERATRMGKAARERVLEHFSIEQWLDRTEAAFAQ